jgi:3-hydroxybutyryl-CoA dehydrogenase
MGHAVMQWWVIRGLAAGDETFTAFRRWRKLGRTTATSRIFAFIVGIPADDPEAIHTYEGRRHRRLIDTAVSRQPPVGPLQAADFIGLDVCLAVMQVLTKRRPKPPLPAAGEIRRSRLTDEDDRGFYDYRGQADPDALVSPSVIRTMRYAFAQ